MQHGSILIEHDPEMITEVLRSKKSKKDTLAEIQATTTSINSHLREKIDFLALKEIVKKSFECTLGITLTQGSLSPVEVTLKENLKKEKYQRHEWNRNRNAPLLTRNLSISAQRI